MSGLLEKSPGLKMIIEFNPALLQSAGVAPLEFLQRLSSKGWRAHLIDETNGQPPRLPDDTSSLVDRLVASGNSANLFCTRE
jgi:hypothetical protein